MYVPRCIGTVRSRKESNRNTGDLGIHPPRRQMQVILNVLRYNSEVMQEVLTTQTEYSTVDIIQHRRNGLSVCLRQNPSHLYTSR